MENDVSVEIRKQRGFPQATRLRRISHRPDGGNASQSTYFWAAAIHLKAGDFLSKEWGDPPVSTVPDWLTTINFVTFVVGVVLLIVGFFV